MSFTTDLLQEVLDLQFKNERLEAHLSILCNAMAEIKAINDGKSNKNTIKSMVDWSLKEIKNLPKKAE